MRLVPLVDRLFADGVFLQVLGRLQKAQRLLKQSKQKDYYKILGVARDADGKTIKKALYVVFSL